MRIIYMYDENDPRRGSVVPGNLPNPPEAYKGYRSLFLTQKSHQRESMAIDTDAFVEILELRNEDVELPQADETLYWCKMFKLQSIYQKSHVVKVSLCVYIFFFFSFFFILITGIWNSCSVLPEKLRICKCIFGHTYHLNGHPGIQCSFIIYCILYIASCMVTTDQHRKITIVFSFFFFETPWNEGTIFNLCFDFNLIQFFSSFCVHGNSKGFSICSCVRQLLLLLLLVLLS